MFGLVALERTVHPSTTMEKLLFLIENVFTEYNPVTTIISLSALAALILMRLFKNMFKKYWFIYRIPEVLVVVILSTGMSIKRVAVAMVLTGGECSSFRTF